MSISFYFITVVVGIISGFIGAVLAQDRVRWYEKKSLANALISESIILNSKINRIIEELKNINNVDNPEKFKPSILHPSIFLGKTILAEISPMYMLDSSYISIFSSNTSKIGMFETEKVTTIIGFYNHIKSLTKYCELINKKIDGSIDINNISHDDREHLVLLATGTITICQYAQRDQDELLLALALYNIPWNRYVRLKIKSKFVSGSACLKSVAVGQIATLRDRWRK